MTTRRTTDCAGIARACLLTGAALCAAARTAAAPCEPIPTPRIVLVKGTTSVKEAAEKNYALSAAKRLGRWLSDCGVAYSALDDSELTTARLTGATVAILAYNPSPDPREVGVLESFVRRGGKLMVFFGADPALARLMDLTVAPRMVDLKSGRWCSFRFGCAAPAFVPERVWQQSRSMRPAYPASDRAQVIAWWEDSEGHALPEPAWVASPNGFWMSHILLDDGDTWNKQRMLLAMLAFHEPSLWQPAARRCLEAAGSLNRFPSYSQTVDAIALASRGRTVEEDVSASLVRADGLRDELGLLIRYGRYAHAVERSRWLRDGLIHAYALAVNSHPNEVRAVWDRTGLGLYPGDWDRTCRELAEYGLTDILPNMLSAGVAHFPNRILPSSPIVPVHGDQLAACVAAAHAHGMRVHVWKICWNLDGAPDALINDLRGKGRLQRTDTGAVVNWLCPSHPDNLRQEREMAGDIVRLYPVDGIHLDYIRYPDSHACFCVGCRQRFEQAIGKPVAQWPMPKGAVALRREYDRWRCAQITRMVDETSCLVRSVNPRVRVSAAVFGMYPSCADSVGQDWGQWLAKGLVDFVCPMNYVTNTQQFAELVSRQMKVPGASGRILPGLGVTAGESWLDPVQVLDQIAVTRQQGCGGYALFGLNRVLATELLPVMDVRPRGSEAQSPPTDWPPASRSVSAR